MTERPFDLVCIDTNQLQENGWPFLSDEMAYFIKLTSNLGIGICLPEPVLAEIRKNFLEDFESAVRNTWASMANLKQKLGILGINSPGGLSPRPQYESICNGYDESAERLFQQFRFERIEYTSMSLAAVFEKALKKEAPFEADGKNFQDAVVFWSFLDRLKIERKKGAFISKDAAFHKKRDLLAGIAKRIGLEFALYHDIAETTKELTAYSDGQAKLWQQQRDELGRLLKEEWDQVSDFILDALRNPKSGLTGDIHLDLVGKCELSEMRPPWIPPIGDRTSSPIPMKFAVRIIFPVFMSPDLHWRFTMFAPVPPPFSASFSKEGMKGDLCVEVHGEISLEDDHVVDFKLKSVNRIEGGYRAYSMWNG